MTDMLRTFALCGRRDDSDSAWKTISLYRAGAFLGIANALELLIKALKMLTFQRNESLEDDASGSTAAATKLAYFFNAVKPAIADHWLCHSIALTYLDSHSACDDELERFSCGPTAFAAIAGVPVKDVYSYFPEDAAWTNRTRMERALQTFGWNFVKLDQVWPKLGLCLIHWCGPWTDRGYAHGILQRTHWVAVASEYVFDVNWRGWLPKENWEDVVVAELLQNHSAARGWKPLTAYELNIS